jgi:hypothetical protein
LGVVVLLPLLYVLDPWLMLLGAGLATISLVQGTWYFSATERQRILEWSNDYFARIARRPRRVDAPGA